MSRLPVARIVLALLRVVTPPVVAFLSSGPVQALPAVLNLSQLHHTRWTAEQGAPTGAWALAQTGDGSLWIGSPSGLFRFDGVRFSRFSLPGHEDISHSDVSALASDLDGGLWIGLRHGGIYSWLDGELRAYGPDQGLPPMATVLALQFSKGRAPLAALSVGIFRLDDGKWRLLGQPRGSGGPNDAEVLSIQQEPDGTLWSSGGAGLHVLSPGAKRFERVASTDGFLARSQDGVIWHSNQASPAVLAPVGGIGHSRSAGKGGVQLEGGTGQLLLDRDGGLWFAHLGGLGRVAEPRLLDNTRLKALRPTSQSMSPAQGLSGTVVRTFLEDRDGNVWIATNGGLDRFRAPRFVRIDHPALFDAAMVPSRDGGIVACTALRGALAVAPGGQVRELPWMPNYCQTVLPLSEESFLAADRASLKRVRQGVAVEIPRDGQASGAGFAWTMAQEQDGALWLSTTAPAGLHRRKDDVWTSMLGLPGMPGPGQPLTMAGAPNGGMWLGFSRNRIAFHLDGAPMRTIDASHGLAIGHAQVFAVRGADVLVGGSAGLALIVDGQTVRPLRGQGDERFAGTSGLVSTPDGAVWIHGTAGVSRVSAEELARVAKDPAHRVSFRRFDHRDGLLGEATQLVPLPSAMRHTDGSLWFSTSRGVFRFEPARAEDMAPPSPVEIQDVVADGTPVLVPGEGKPLRLAAGTNRLEIDYTAFNLSLPERVSFRYRLDGIDDDWLDAGTRRRISYTNLSPASYRLRIQSAVENAAWNPQTATLEFSIAPRYYQTVWFRALCIGAAVLMLWCLYRWRLRSMAARLLARMEAQAQERDRIARELHDTLLQSTQSLIYNFGALAERNSDADERQRLDLALQRAESVMAEGRHRVQDLRTRLDGRTELSQALLLSDEGAAEPPILRATVQGAPRRLNPWVLDEAARIGQEAISNARRHAKASRIELLVTYGKRTLELVVRDDGCGMDADVLKAGTRPDHWGLQGMSERAARVGGVLTLACPEGGGTQVALTVPASKAYARESVFLRWRRS